MTSTKMLSAIHTPVYPGEYEPLPRKKKELLRALKKMYVAEPPVNIIEMTDYYKIELAIPGLRREDIFVSANGRVLSVAAAGNQHREKNKPHFHLHDFNCDCFSRNVTLPADADTDFYTATYNNGILSICFYKNSHSGTPIPGPIIVY